jgi:hypothetical protein
MKDRRKVLSVVIMSVIAALVAALGMFVATPAQASGGWGFGMGFGPSVVASCSSYNLVAARVDIPAHSYAGYVTGRLSNPRTNTSKGPAFGIDTVTAAGSPTLTYIIFNPPTGTVDGDILHVALALSALPGGTPVGSFEFSYRCATGEVIRLSDADVLVSTAINQGYGNDYVLANVGTDALGKPDLQLWCVGLQGAPAYTGMTITRAVVAGLPASLSANTLVDHNNSCSVPVAFYVLTSGEYQVTIGPDPYGVVNEMIFTGLPPTGVHFLRYNVNQGFNP